METDQEAASTSAQNSIRPTTLKKFSGRHNILSKLSADELKEENLVFRGNIENNLQTALNVANRCNDQNVMMARLNKRVDDLETANDVKDRRMKDLLEENTSFRKRLSDLEKEKTELQSRVTLIEEENVGLKSRMTELEMMAAMGIEHMEEVMSVMDSVETGTPNPTVSRMKSTASYSRLQKHISSFKAKFKFPSFSIFHDSARTHSPSS